jgi:hypothetical protein
MSVAKVINSELWIEIPIRQPNQSEISASKVAQEAA